MTHIIRLIHADDSTELIIWPEPRGLEVSHQGRCYRLYGLIDGDLTYQEYTCQKTR